MGVGSQAVLEWSLRLIDSYWCFYGNEHLLSYESGVQA